MLTYPNFNVTIRINSSKFRVNNYIKNLEILSRYMFYISYLSIFEGLTWKILKIQVTG